MEQNKARSYLFYAVGEITLVMIGILLALQVNNWNEKRKEIALEKEVLQEIQTDIDGALESLQNDVRLNDSVVKAINTIIHALENNQTYHDSLGQHFARLTFSTTITIDQSAYDNLKNIGFQVIRNDSLRKMITAFYEAEYTFLKRYEINDMTTTKEYFTPRYLDYIEEIQIRNETPFSREYTPADFESLKSDADFKRLLNYLKQTKDQTLYILASSLETLKTLKSEVEIYRSEIQ